MSCRFKIENLTEELTDKITKDLKIKIDANVYSFGNKPTYIIPYLIEDDDIYLPFSYAYRTLKFKRPSRENFPTIEPVFTGSLRPEQEIVKREAIRLLSKKGNVVLSMYCGFGKTITSIKIACDIHFKTLIIVNKIVLMKQWESSILKVSPQSKIQMILPASKLKEADFYIINATNVCKKGHEFFQNIGTVIVDEVHMIMAETLSKSLYYIKPRYLIGLSATPYRPDGLDSLLDLYFGEDKITRKLFKPHIAYKVTTNFKPTVELTQNGKVNWNVILDSQAMDRDRNELIIKIVQYFRDRTFLILTKRVAQGEYLVARLTEVGEDVSSLIGSQQTFELSSRVLVGTNSKIGVGFDHPNLNSMILACDLEEYFIQYLGRCMRTEEVEPIIFDLVDKNSILEKHFSTRRAVYLEHGGTVKNFRDEFPEFQF